MEAWEICKENAARLLISITRVDWSSSSFRLITDLRYAQVLSAKGWGSQTLWPNSSQVTTGMSFGMLGCCPVDCAGTPLKECYAVLESVS